MKKLLSLCVLLLTALSAWADYAVIDGVRYQYDPWGDEFTLCSPGSEDPAYTGVVNIPATLTYNEKEYTVTKMQNGVFKGSTVTKVTFPATMETIGYEAFRDVTTLTEVVLPVGVKKIESYAFQNCTNLTSITLPEGLNDIGGNAFEGSGLKEITIPGTVQYLHYGCFYGCSDLTSVTLARSYFLSTMSNDTGTDVHVFTSGATATPYSSCSASPWSVRVPGWMVVVWLVSGSTTSMTNCRSKSMAVGCPPITAAMPKYRSKSFWLAIFTGTFRASTSLRKK